ncbi:PepSY-associated TM helix domain-containing protein [Caldimonas brevitalea]|uniref:Iron-regulated membrane protein n=1 Tax=Caldimonas brevitalea TaxID=413882 RepID=A0A0G3BJS9_9BURK|nr:PepSY-associated TM helix domain-containing protein [Caldimonas brevitalea]AKJ29647.1 hypothetical protein AAW51_2956 [Caldimonas brevitalea]
MARAKARQAWRLAHRWLGLSLGLLLLLSGLTGAALVVARPLDAWAHPELFRATPVTGEVQLDAIRQRLVHEFGSGTTLTFRPPRVAGEALQVFVRGDAWHGTLHLDPASGDELGRRGEHEGVFNFLFELHATLLLEDTGRAVLATAVLAYLVLLVSGVVLWWPARWCHAVRIKLDAGMLRALFDLHRVTGAALGLGILVSVVSGAYMAWRPLSAWVTQVSGGVARSAPALPATAAASQPVSLDAVVAEARRRLPQGQLGYVQWPPAGKAGRVRLRLPDDPHPNGLSSVYFDPRDGAVLAVHRWHELDTGARAYTWVYPLHIGSLGGPWQTVVNLLFGAALAGLGGSGLVLWWQRRARPAPARGRAVGVEGAPPKG